ncbi:MAG: GDP-L-fucose synthase [Victivallales bacterium]|nr:GDP-L-fucose synthase [Victivallales bacterium]
MEKTDKLYIAGHKGMVGSACLNLYKRKGFTNIITKDSKELDLRDSHTVSLFFETEKPDYVILAAAKVGGINYNSKHQAEFLYDNLMIEANVIHNAYLNGVKKLCYLGSSCIYPSDCPQPIREEYLLTGPLEPTNEGYAVAKIAGFKLAYYYAKQYGFNTISLMPCNLYGANDCFDLEKSHVLSALVKRFVDAVSEKKSSVKLWGTGIAKREFLNVQDCAEAIYYLMENWSDPNFINIGSGREISIEDLALLVAKETGFNGSIQWDSTKPNGMLRKCMDVSKLKSTGFKPKISLNEGIKELIKEYKKLKNKN